MSGNGGTVDDLPRVAIVGFGLRVPGARTPEELWAMLRDGVEGIEHFPYERRERSLLDPDEQEDPTWVGAAGVLPDAGCFDAGFFGYNPLEAAVIDPQQRVFLECAWEALEHAGVDTVRLEGAVGVFAGAGANTYQFNLFGNRQVRDLLGSFQLSLANNKDFVTTRTAYHLDLRGPCVTVQTACSTSLVAVHLACQSLINGECDLALAGGVTVRAAQREGYRYVPGSILSRDGHCRAFDASATGTVPGNGAAIVVLRRLADAVADGDTIYAVIRGSAINNDGARKVGFTAPGVEGQAAVISEALLVAGVEPETISYIEAHGTGTELGDPIEVAALAEVFAGVGDGAKTCALGSVKSNVGHLDTAAGVLGLIKTALAISHGEIPGSLHFERPNPRLELERTPFRVSASLTPWSPPGGPRRAGVSSFGIGGTNAHVVLEEAPVQAPGDPVCDDREAWELLPLSAKTPAALARASKRLAEHLAAHPEQPLAEVAHTLQVGRRELPHRRAVVCRDAADGARRLAETATAGATGAPPPLVFMFPGQGSQHVDMARALHEGDPAFRADVEACCEAARPRLGRDLRELLFPEPSAAEECARRLANTAFAQPALFAVEYALARRWIDWGLEPRAMIGHSVGELAAACIAGVWSLDDAMALVCERGRLMQAAEPGAMLTVALPEDEVCAMLPPSLVVAAVNARRADGGLGAHPRHRAFRDRARPAGRRVLPPVAHLACVSLAHDGPGGGGLRVGGARRERARARDPVRFLHDRRMDRRR